MVQPRGLAWRRWQERRRLRRVVRLLSVGWWRETPSPISSRVCRAFSRRGMTVHLCDPDAPDPAHVHRWEDIFARRLERARRLRSIHGRCGCRRCSGRSRCGRCLTVGERLDRIRVREQVAEESIKGGCVAARPPRNQA